MTVRDERQRNVLTSKQASDYWKDGFLFPVPVFTPDEAQDYRAQLEVIEEEWSHAGLPRPIEQYLRVHAECVLPLAVDIALHPAVLDSVESILGPDLMVWSSEFFIKEANSASFVSMHQDLTYWGFGETSDQLTAWIALSPSTVESGCMDLVRGSHKNPILEHTDTHGKNNILSRGQEVAVDVTDEDKTHVVLRPGEMSLHHGKCIHGSGPNKSDDRRIGFAIRYINPGAKQQSVDREYAMLARGIDRTSSFIHYAPPTFPFSASSLTIYEEMRAQQNKVLAEGMKEGKQLYDQMQ